MTDDPIWKQDVTVIGIGETGAETVRMIGTETDVKLYTVNSEPELEACFKDVEESDFVFLSGDLTEPDVENQVLELLHRSRGVSILFAEGLTSLPQLVDKVNLLVPVRCEPLSRSIISAAMADVFESMMPLTGHNLGHGDIKIVAGQNMVAELFIETPRNEKPFPLTPLRNCEKSESVLLFLCSGEKQSAEKVHSKIEEHGFPDDVNLLWDQRIHPRYIGTPHFKHFVTYEGLEENMEWKEKNDYTPEGRSSINIEDNQFFSRKD
ncbi:hypothetical protein [Haloplanus natans]|uniref:hypothetical protein n=1 Tax=Haloplanus natans TaxID=376171 RepID=UPI000677CD3B|nr:hypothetical protein [Haloplanus natans]